MTARLRPLAGSIAALLLVAACGGGALAPSAAAPVPSVDPPPQSSAVSQTPSASARASLAPSVSAGPEPSVAVELTQTWATAELTDVATGESFRIADHAGKVLFIETMAIWCTKCRDQQADALEALQRLDDPNVVYVVLDTDPGESAADLAAYEKKRGWEVFTYAISPRNVSRALAAEFGDFVLNPPSTPLIVVGTDGTVTLTEFRHKGVDELIALARQHGA